MEIQTKYDLGQVMWYVGQQATVTDPCPACGCRQHVSKWAVFGPAQITQISTQNELEEEDLIVDYVVGGVRVDPAMLFPSADLAQIEADALNRELEEQAGGPSPLSEILVSGPQMVQVVEKPQSPTDGDDDSP